MKRCRCRAIEGVCADRREGAGRSIGPLCCTLGRRLPSLKAAAPQQQYRRWTGRRLEYRRCRSVSAECCVARAVTDNEGCDHAPCRRRHHPIDSEQPLRPSALCPLRDIWRVLIENLTVDILLYVYTYI